MEQRISDIQNKTVVVAPLDWGLGHATRCIPIIKELLKNNNTCIIATSGRSLELLKQEFPNCIYEEIPAYGITYSKSAFGMIWKLLFQIPKSLITKNKESKIADELVKKYNVDCIISDNRFGMYSKLCKSIFITHQIRIRLPLLFRWLEYPFYLINKRMISKFNECWIPDYAGTKNLSGILSHSWSVPHSHFIGPLTGRESTECVNTFDVVAILSGPEPQRTIFENKLRHFTYIAIQSCLFGEFWQKNYLAQVGNCTIQTFATNSEINKLLCGSKLIISRGYSSIMDYENWELKQFWFLPQDKANKYLGKYLQHKPNYWCINQ